MNLRGNIFSLCLLCLGVATPVSQAAPLSINLDTVIDWESPDPISLIALEDLMLPLGKYRSHDADEVDSTSHTKWSEFSRGNFHVSFLGGEFAADQVSLGLAKGAFFEFSLQFSLKGRPPGFLGVLETRLAQKMNHPATRTMNAVSKSPMLSWNNGLWRIYVITTGEDKVLMTLLKSVRRTQGPAAVSQTSQNLEVTVDLDYLLNLAALWNCTADAFEKIYRPKKEGQQEQPPQFEWLSADRSRARFSKKLFSNLEAKLTIFAKSVKVDEAIVEFVDGRAARVTMSLYNRGDSGDISPEQFDLVYKTTGKNLSQILKLAPLNISNTVTSAVKTVSWQWRSPVGIALLEHNDYKSGRTMGRPEFLRLKLANPQQADWSIGKLSVGVQRMALMKNITKMDNGDVYIAGVPMVDQGDKGYCVAASCQRLFEYMQIPCDQHEIAQLAGVDAQSGANIFDMQKSLARIDGHYKVSFKPYINPELYYSTTGKRRISERQFAVIIKEHVDKAVPLLWALQLGRFPEEPPLPNGGQVSGGHMRMIIGYNTAKKQVIFTDSWGAGHEIKRMSEAGAYEATVGLYTMSPRGL